MCYFFLALSLFVRCCPGSVTCSTFGFCCPLSCSREFGFPFRSSVMLFPLLHCFISLSVLSPCRCILGRLCFYSVLFVPFFLSAMCLLCSPDRLAPGGWPDPPDKVGAGPGAPHPSTTRTIRPPGPSAVHSEGIVRRFSEKIGGDVVLIPSEFGRDRTSQ